MTQRFLRSVLIDSRTWAATILLSLSLVTPALAQQRERPDTVRSDTAAVRMLPITVTATRTETDVFDVPAPVSVLGREAIRELMPNTVTDLFRGLPGLDVAGVGPTQVRPVIRGQRGQRILLLSDGLRLNNTRRQQDFGEIPGLVDIESVERVEVVRGPASVLYGSDAIGGVVNIITQKPRLNGLHGSLGYRFGSTLDQTSVLTNEDQHRVVGSLAGRFGALSFQARGSYRDVDPYAAPEGSFGNITLPVAQRVQDTGVQDESVDGYLGYSLAPAQNVFLKYERYTADSAGFGYVDPNAYAPGDPLIQIRYPFQQFNKWTAGYTGVLNLPFVDKVDFAGYRQTNERRFTFDIMIPTGGAPGPDSVVIDQRNYTDIQTWGGRLEAKKLVGERVALTYGADLFRDATDNTDTSTAATYFAAPPFPGGPTVFEDPPTAPPPLVPNASFRSLGVFFQSEFDLGRATVIVGGRFQDVKAQTRDTPGITEPATEATDRTVVGAANAILRVTDNVSVISSVGRAFRSPNLVERFFSGPVPEGNGYQLRNPDLKAETSLNVDLGARYRDRLVFLEGFVFQNTISDAIRIEATGAVNAATSLPEFQNVNLDQLRARGVEIAGSLQLPVGVSVGGNFTYIDTKNVTADQNNPTGDSFSSQISGNLRYQAPSGRFFGEYQVRHNGERDDAEILAGNPIGNVLPAFTVHSIRAGVTVLRSGAHSHRISLAVRNLTNELYAEFSNASFFRPEARRNLIVSYDLTF
jgi:outer membrane receptor protein involved in Fe transport